MDGFLAKQKMLKLVQDKVENLEAPINIVKHIAKAVLKICHFKKPLAPDILMDGFYRQVNIKQIVPSPIVVKLFQTTAKKEQLFIKLMLP